MALVRGVFWLCLVAMLVPYSRIDLPNATFAVDRAALSDRLARLPQFCADNPVICRKAGALAGVIAEEGVTFATILAGRIKAEAADARL